MGIPTDPPDDFGDDCATCFAAGKTPAVLWMLVAGVEIGPNWDSFFHSPPPNGVWKLEQNLPCRWQAQISNYEFTYIATEINPASAVCGISQIAEPWPCFFEDGTAECEHFFTNQNPQPLLWTGGNAQILYNIVDGLYSLQATMALLNIAPAPHMFAEPNVMTGETVMHRFASHLEVTNIKIKQEY